MVGGHTAKLKIVRWPATEDIAAVLAKGGLVVNQRVVGGSASLCPRLRGGKLRKKPASLAQDKNAPE